MQRLPLKQRLLMMLMICVCANVSHAQDCEPHWSDEFAAADLDNIVRALATFDDGHGGGPAVYAGGFFTTGGDVVLNRIGKLVDNAWAPLGTGMDSSVFALMGFDAGPGGRPGLIAGGNFTTTGVIQANYIASWGGQAWSPLGGGLNHAVYALGSFDDGQGDGPALYAGGLFTAAGELPANYVAKWDGQGWSPLGDGVNGLVLAMTEFDDGTGNGPALYVAGGFTQAGEVEANFIAKWDGENWSALGEGMDGAVRTVVVFDDGSGPALYAGGSFTAAGGVAANSIAKWDGVSWSSVGTGVDGSIRALVVSDDRNGDGLALYVGGLFDEAGGVEAKSIARWDGSTWSTLGSGVDGSVSSLTAADDGSGDGSKLFVGGFFQEAGEIRSPYIAKWNGTEWSTTGKGMVGDGSFTTVADLQPFDDGTGEGVALYAGGVFTSAGGVGSRWIAKWDGANWFPVGTESDDGDGAIYSLTAFRRPEADSPDLYAGGWFDIIGGITAKSVARWDGAKWLPLGYVPYVPCCKGTGVNGPVYSLAVFDDGEGEQLYVGGVFSDADGQDANNIARWDGSQWSVLGEGITGGKNVHSKVRSMTVFDDGSGESLYVSGHFTTAGGIPASGVARWDGTSWSPVGLGIPVDMFETVYSLAVYDDGSGSSLYAGGRFDSAGKVEANGLARWDGREWSAVGGGSNGTITSLFEFDDGLDGAPALFVAGFFLEVGNVPANHIARWNGLDWSPLGAGVGEENPAVWTLSSFHDGTGPALFAGGQFTTAGGHSSAHIAKWIVCQSAIPGDVDGNGIVDGDDLAILLANWGPCGNCDDCPADLDDDCTVGVSDLLILLSNWG